MNTSITISKEVAALLKENEQPTTVAAEVVVETPPPAPAAIEPTATNDKPPTTNEIAEQPKPPKTKMSDSMLRSFCGALVTMVDFVQDMAFSNLADKKMLKKSRLIAGNIGVDYIHSLLKKRHEDEAATFTQEEMQLIDLFDKVQTFKDDLAFTDDQTESLKDTLMLYLKEKGYEFSPETILIFMLISSITPNAIALRML